MQCWRPNFDLFEDKFKKMLVWVKIPGLPIEFYNKHFLWRLGNCLGRTVKVDTNILRRKEETNFDLVERARFAWICVKGCL